MRINPKMFNVPGEDQPFEVQEFDDRKIELFYMNDYDVILRDQINKGKFSVWSSVDGRNYRLFLEKGLYEAINELYTLKINKIWVEFWDRTEKISNKFTKLGLLPIGLISIIVCIVSGMFGDIGSYVAIGVLIVAFIAMMVINSKMKSKIMLANKESRDLIVAALGTKKFDRLIDAQKEYMDSYYDSLYSNDEENEELEETKEVIDGEEPKTENEEK